MRPASLALVLPILCTAAAAADHPELKAYPPAPDGMERFVIVLPDKTRAEEGDFKVELVVGKSVEGDGVNRMFLNNSLARKTVKGWGYDYWEVTGPGTVASTLIGVPPGTPRVAQFVAAKPELVRYNSRLPIVVYAPKGYTVRYNVWTRGKKAKDAEKG